MPNRRRCGDFERAFRDGPRSKLEQIVSGRTADGRSHKSLWRFGRCEYAMAERTIKLLLWGAILVIMAAMYSEQTRLYYNHVVHPHANGQ